MAQKKNEIRLVNQTGTRVVNEYFDSLPVQLTSEELYARSKSLVRLRDDERKAEAEFSEAKETHKKIMATVSAERERLEQAIRDEREFRPVKVQSVAHYSTARMVDTRTDTNQIIGERSLTTEEMQFKLDLGSDEGAEEASAQ